MSYIQGPIPPTGPDPISIRIDRAPPARAPASGDPQDTVTISEIARLKAKLAELPDIRTDLVEAVRAELEAGDYETIEKVRIAAAKLLQELKEEGAL